MQNFTLSSHITSNDLHDLTISQAQTTSSRNGFHLSFGTYRWPGKSVFLRWWFCLGFVYLGCDITTAVPIFEKRFIFSHMHFLQLKIGTAVYSTSGSISFLLSSKFMGFGLIEATLLAWQFFRKVYGLLALKAFRYPSLINRSLKSLQKRTQIIALKRSIQKG